MNGAYSHDFNFLKSIATIKKSQTIGKIFERIKINRPFQYITCIIYHIYICIYICAIYIEPDKYVFSKSKSILFLHLSYFNISKIQ